MVISVAELEALLAVVDDCVEALLVVVDDCVTVVREEERRLLGSLIQN